MENEFEIRVLDIDVKETERKLLEIGAIKEGKFFQKRKLYNFHEEYRGRFIRLRTNGTKTTLTIKDKSAKKEIGSVKELEIEVSDFEKTNEIMNMLGYEHSMYQENKRTIYRLGDVEFDIDTWPMIPTYLEIEGKNKEQVEEMIKKLDIDKDKLSLDKVSEIYKKYGYYKETQVSIVLEGSEGAEKIKQIMNDMRSASPEKIGSAKVLKFKDFDRDVQKDLVTGETTTTGLSKSNVLYYELEDDGWCCIRPSGTEPKIKLYIGVKDESEEKAINKMEELKEELSKIIK